MIPSNALLIGQFFVFVRVATCLMVLPGFSAAQVAMRIRLFLAIGISFSIFLLVADDLKPELSLDPASILLTSLSEMLIALAIALPVRFLFLALSFLGEIITQLIGLNPIPGTPIADDQLTTTMSGLFNATAVVLFFAAGLHISLILALAASFSVFPPGEMISLPAFLETVTNDLQSFFAVVTRLGAPLIIYAIIVNLIAGLVNKLTPQIPIYFVSTPFLICGGVVLLVWVGDDMLLAFIEAVAALVARFH